MNKKNLIMSLSLGAVLSMSIGASSAAPETSKNVLWYNDEARNWEKEALPIGNGRLGAMLFGGVFLERIQFNEDSLWIGDETDTGAYQAFGDIYLDLHERKIEGQSIECPSGQSGAKERNEGISQSVDGNEKTKWCVTHEGRPVQWLLHLEAAQVLKEYTFTTANDMPARDPKKWQWEGSKDGLNWTLLHEVEEASPVEARFHKKNYSFANEEAYTSYRLTLLANHGDHRLYQLGEIALSGIPLAAKDAYEPGVELTQSYRRELDIDRAIHTTSYALEGVNYRRESFSSNPADVMVFRYEADKPGSYTGTLKLTDMHAAEIKVEGTQVYAAGDVKGYQFSGYGDHVRRDHDINLNYESRVQIIPEGGEVVAQGTSLSFKGCDALTILVAADTDYINQRNKGWKKALPREELKAQLAAATAKPYATLKQEHIADYQQLFNTLSIDLGGEVKDIPTNELLAGYKTEHNAAVEALLFQYARYLMISCSREGSLPANLQGLWNESNNPPWRCDYHTDVNLEMNYWFVNAANLQECFQPLGEWVNSIREVKKELTKKQFGIERGWMLQAENGIFGGGSAFWSKGDASWVAQILYDNYAFNRDPEYLKNRLYPVLKELCQLWEDGLKELPDGTLVIPNGFSPEHGPHEDGVSFDQQLVYNLFSNYLVSAKILGVDEDYQKTVADMRSRLLAPQIGKWGQLQEWMVDRDDPENKHRHVSHMIAVYPGHQISPVTTPDLAEAARLSLNARGDYTTGWSRAWKTSIWARLHDGNRAHRIMNGLVSTLVYPNLLATHPPFQIDANFGFAAGVCEMLIQSHTEEIQLLPALPDKWVTGNIKGIRARGDYTLDLSWKDGKLDTITIHAGARSPGTAKLLYLGKRKEVTVEPGNSITVQGAELN